MSQIRILLADDHHLVREAVGAFLGDALEDAVIVEAATLPDALQRVSESDGFDIVLLDFDMPGMDGLAGVSRLKSACGETPVVVISGNIREHEARRALDAGAAGVVTKDFKSGTLIEVVQCLTSGRPLPQSLMLHARPDRQEGLEPGTSADIDTRRDRLGGLSRREYATLMLLADGLSNKEIARRLDLVEGTVKNHLHNVFRKLGARNRTDAIRLAMEQRS